MQNIFPIHRSNLANPQAKVSATVRLFFFFWGGGGRFITYVILLLTKFKKTLGIHMKHIKVLDFDDKSDGNGVFPLET